jgi:uncharacterized membrane protein
MDSEVPHLIFRSLHVLSGVMWVGQLWSLALVLRVTPESSPETTLAATVLRAHQWHQRAATSTWLTGLPLLGIVYYSGGAATPNQSLGLATAVGLTALFVAVPLYEAVWSILARRPAAAMLLSLVLVAAAASALTRVMTGRTVFVHLGAMLATIMLENVWRRIWPVEKRRLSTTPGLVRPSLDEIESVARRLRHNVVLSVAVILFMVSNHFPLLYGQSLAWLLAPIPLIVGWLVMTLVHRRPVLLVRATVH